MKKIVIIGAGEFQNPLILKAKDMGYETHVFAWESGDVGEKTADFFYPISIIDKEKILEVSKKIKPDVVTSIGSDLATLTVNFVARELGLVCNPERNDYCSTNKFLMRQAFEKGGVTTPHFMCVGLEDSRNDFSDKKLQYPLIVKPTDRSGSRGIQKVYNKCALEKAIKKACELSFEKKAIVEDVIEGEEYSCESISFEGMHHILAFTKKYTTGEPNYIEIGHIQPAYISESIKKKVEEEILMALDALDVKYGAAHSEFRIDKNGNVRIIEIGARMGGDCIGSDLVLNSTGNDFLKMVIEVASGQKPEIKKSKEEVAVVKFIFNENDLIYLDEVSKHSKVRTIRKEIKKITKEEITDSSKRYGFFIFKCDSREIAEKIMTGESISEN